MIEDVLADSIQGNQFTPEVLDQQAASHEKAAAIADQINEEVVAADRGQGGRGGDRMHHERDREDSAWR